MDSKTYIDRVMWQDYPVLRSFWQTLARIAGKKAETQVAEFIYSGREDALKGESWTALKAMRFLSIAMLLTFTMGALLYVVSRMLRYPVAILMFPLSLITGYALMLLAPRLAENVIGVRTILISAMEDTVIYPLLPLFEVFLGIIPAIYVLMAIFTTLFLLFQSIRMMVPEDGDDQT